MTSEPFIWRLSESPSPAGDAVEAALRLEVAKLSYGPLEFEFAKSRAPGGEVVLTLRLDGATPMAERTNLLAHNEQLVPRAPKSLPAKERASLEARYLEILGRGLFDDVAHLVRLELDSR